MKYFHRGLLPLLVVSATARPAAEIFRRQDDSGPDHQNICLKELTKDVWVDNDYTSVLKDILKDGDAKKAGPLGVIKDHAQTVDGFVCDPTSEDNPKCSSQNLGTEETCNTIDDPKNDPKAVTLLKAVANFANFMTSCGAEASKAADEVKGMELDIFTAFDKKSDTDGIFGNSGPYIIASALAGAIPALGGIGAGVFGLLIGINSLTAQSDTTWQESMQYTKYVQAISSGLKSGFSGVADNAINKVPEDVSDLEAYFNDDDSALPQLLASGDFADAHSQTASGENKDDIKAIIVSAAINSILISNKVFVARFSKKSYPSLDGDGGGDPCGDQTDLVPYPKEIKWCDDTGNAYVLQTWDGSDTSVKGFDEFSKFGVDPMVVMQNSWEWQKKHGFGHELDDKDVEGLKEVIGDGKDLDRKRLQLYSLPVCDLEAAADTEEDISIQDTDFACGDDEMAPCLFREQMYFRCGTVDGWPLGNVPNLEDTPPISK